jgi:hypothetical protein
MNRQCMAKRFKFLRPAKDSPASSMNSGGDMEYDFPYEHEPLKYWLHREVVPCLQVRHYDVDCFVVDQLTVSDERIVQGGMFDFP